MKIKTISNWFDKLTDHEHFSLDSPLLSSLLVDSFHSIHGTNRYTHIRFISLKARSFYSFPFSSSSSSFFFITDGHMKNRFTDRYAFGSERSRLRNVTGRRVRIRLEIGSPVQCTMKQWDCYVRGRKGEEPRALERSPFICKYIGKTSDRFKKILSRIIRSN